MKIYFCNSNDGHNYEYYGETEYLPIPRIGERVGFNYIPATKVLDVVYSYKHNLVTVLVDGPVSKIFE